MRSVHKDVSFDVSYSANWYWSFKIEGEFKIEDLNKCRPRSTFLFAVDVSQLVAQGHASWGGVPPVKMQLNLVVNLKDT